MWEGGELRWLAPESPRMPVIKQLLRPYPRPGDQNPWGWRSGMGVFTGHLGNSDAHKRLGAMSWHRCPLLSAPFLPYC